MKYLVTIVLFFIGFGNGFAQSGLIPQPVAYHRNSGEFTLTALAKLSSDSGVPAALLKLTQEQIRSLTGFTLPVSSTNASISLKIDSLKVSHPEGYHLRIQPKSIELIGHDQAGLFYGVQSLVQLISQSSDLRLPACSIKDYPRFSYRGMHLDVSRHWFRVPFIKKYIDLLAQYKFNTFHWHLTDDQGWRIEIKRYPQLQETAAFRSQTLIGHKRELPHRFDGKKYGGYYTQDEVREVVRYAAQRHITIIPEIEMPGHALAALSAFPALGCTGGPYQAATFWGIFDDVYCAGNDSTFTFLQHVLDEVVELFPSKYIHIGGDECPKTRWKSCPKCQARMKHEGLKDEHELQSYFIQRMEKYLLTKNREIIGWDEILEGGLSPGATVMSWRGTEGGIEAMRQKHKAIMTPEMFVYFDFYQSLYPQEQVAAAWYTPLSKVYSYEPVPDSLTQEEASYLLGVQGNVWSEYLSTDAKAEYMIFPRALAVAEIAWSPKTGRTYTDFLRRLRKNESLLKRLKVNYAKVFDEITDTVLVTAPGKIQLRLKTTLPQATIRYTTDGSEPQATSSVYTSALSIPKTQTIRAAVFQGKVQQGRVFEKSFTISKSTGKPLLLATAPKGNFIPSSSLVAVNGVQGTARYNTGEWLGFLGENAEWTLDLQKTEMVSEISINVLKYHWQRFWEPTALHMLVSEDGKNYREVYQHKDFPINGINEIKGQFQPTRARFVKIKAENKGIVPAGEYGAGNKAWLLMDELIVN
ncbi:family 20 glycosylhydrolase [Siphonobacter sp. SORGH_AS_0500]|uniref:glycoside hydrolase family 20 protein n=1 Tax=Siphonobacter sp. SORGH_AS_0500 TaxID=1864824 RepID=UPI00286177C9|nr:family 20 glycosylhydrolase [Siphonobacter sp. SORGH_AS_0500]MDR6196395.1 hexosaminidase [Siphonobacter sp. SORGH_AS_0500]